MKKVTLFTLFALSFAIAATAFGAKPGGGGGNQREPGYRVMAKNCSLAVTPERSLLLSGGAGENSMVKIQWMKKMPADITLNDDGISTATGIAYLAADTVIPEIIVEDDSNLGKIYTEASVGALLTSGSIKSLSTKAANVEYIEAGSLGFVKMWSQADSATAGYATCSIATTKTGTLKIHLTGIVLENLITAQDVQAIKADSKKAKKSKKKFLKPPDNTGAPKGVSLGGVGRVTPDALVDAESPYVVIAKSIKRIQTKGASVSPDLLQVEGNLDRIQAKPSKFSGATTGGFIGQSDEATTQTTVVAKNMKRLDGQVGVAGVFIAGADANGDPDYSGTIDSISTKPRTGSLRGEAHVSAAKPIKFKPEQGDFVVYTSAPPVTP